MKLIEHPTPAPTGAAASPQRSHTHRWRTESSHHTSEGIVRYVHCGSCGARRVESRASQRTTERGASPASREVTSPAQASSPIGRS